MADKARDFDEQLRQAVRASMNKREYSTREIARQSGVALPTLAAWLTTPTRSLRLDTAEKLAQCLKIDLQATDVQHSRRNPERSRPFADQLRDAVEKVNKSALARSAEVPLSTITTWLAKENSKVSLRVVFALCSSLRKDLLVSNE